MAFYTYTIKTEHSPASIAARLRAVTRPSRRLRKQLDPAVAAAEALRDTPFVGGVDDGAFTVWRDQAYGRTTPRRRRSRPWPPKVSGRIVTTPGGTRVTVTIIDRVLLVLVVVWGAMGFDAIRHLVTRSQSDTFVFDLIGMLIIYGGGVSCMLGHYAYEAIAAKRLLREAIEGTPRRMG